MLRIIDVTETIVDETNNAGRTAPRIALLPKVFCATAGFVTAALHKVRRIPGRLRQMFFHAKSACVNLALIPDLN